MHISTAGMNHVSLLAPLFDDYRLFYRQTSDLDASRDFLQERIANKESIIFIALNEDKNTALGFAQLYPCFSSISMRRIYILNDLYVVPEHRKQNIARRLLQTVKEFATQHRAVELVLSTEVTNIAAQHLYESFGYQKNHHYFEYNLKLDQPE